MGAPQTRRIRREHDGKLVDEQDGRTVTLAELRDDVRAGRRFRVRRAGGGSATYAVLAELLTGREPAVGSSPASSPGPKRALERALRGAFELHEQDDRAERRRPKRACPDR